MELCQVECFLCQVSILLQLKQEGKAVFLLRKAMQKLTAASPENFEEFQKEFEETIKVQLEAAEKKHNSIDFSILATSYQHWSEIC